MLNVLLHVNLFPTLPCFSAVLVTALHVTRAVVELSAAATTSVLLAVTKVVTYTHINWGTAGRSKVKTILQTTQPEECVSDDIYSS